MHDIETIPKKNEMVILLALILAASPIIITYLLLILSSFSEEMLTSLSLSSFRPTIVNWINVFKGKTAITGGITVNIWHYTLTTLLVALGITGLVVLISTMAGYALSRMRFRGRKKSMIFLLLLHSFPGVSLIVGVYFMYRLTLPTNPLALRVYSFLYVILARGALEIPMSVWLMKGFFDSIPWEFEWSGIIDGASRIKVWKDIMVPLIKPGIMAIAIFAFLAGWGDLIYVRTFLIDPTLATYIESNLEVEFTHLPLIAAVGTFYLLPTIIFFILAHQLLLKTYVGGIKG